jgi:hypothetical protein
MSRKTAPLTAAWLGTWRQAAGCGELVIAGVGDAVGVRVGVVVEGDGTAEVGVRGGCASAPQPATTRVTKSATGRPRLALARAIRSPFSVSARLVPVS